MFDLFCSFFWICFSLTFFPFLFFPFPLPPVVVVNFIGTMKSNEGFEFVFFF